MLNKNALFKIKHYETYILYNASFYDLKIDDLKRSSDKEQYYYYYNDDILIKDTIILLLDFKPIKKVYYNHSTTNVIYKCLFINHLETICFISNIKETKNKIIKL